MANLRAARRNLYAIAGILIVVDIIALVILLSPVGAAGADKQWEFDQLRHDVQAKTKTVVPPDQVQQRIDEARKQIVQFQKDRIPAEASAISIELGRLASEAGVKLSTVRYEEVDSDVPDLREYRITALISGDYLQEVKFINAVERSKQFYVIDNVNLAEQQQGAVRLQITLDTYMREGQ